MIHAVEGENPFASSIFKRKYSVTYKNGASKVGEVLVSMDRRIKVERMGVGLGAGSWWRRWKKRG